MPYFRIFSPILQSTKYDKDAIYIKKWLPQLKDIIPKHLHDWEKYNMMYIKPSLDYVKPIINYNDSKKKTLAMYRV
jgi:deoxyribodipyrimidine photo-lyase